MNDVCRRFRRHLTGDLEYDYRTYQHECKEAGDLGSDDGDFTDAELVEKLKEFLGLEDLR